MIKVKRPTKHKSLLRYPGGKSFAVPIILPHFPVGVKEMVSPFFGGGSIEIECAYNGIRVHGYDIFEPIVNFWQQVLTNKVKLHQAVSKYPIPLPKVKFYILQKSYDKITDPVEKAAVFFVLNRTSFSGLTFSGGMSPKQHSWSNACIDKLREFQVGGLFNNNNKLSVELGDFNESLTKHQDLFAYMDPPYLLETSNLYGDRGSTHKDFDHIGFFEKVKQMKNKWMISYNGHPDLLKMYKDYNIVTVEWQYSMRTKGGTKPSDEILIMNY